MKVVNYGVFIAIDHKLVHYKFLNKKFLFLYLLNFDINYSNTKR
jgi:hypothetical protein